MTVKVSLNLPVEDVETLKGLAAERGMTMTQVLRQAIKGEKLLNDAQRQGGEVLIRQNGETQRLVFR